ncbi:extracellular solute-binding protein [Haloarculaceae archaeon H-GB2-1]|nr:extracellular solute-binding protein [Haloarculaceae archaeon H-GB2-1]
MKSAPADDPPYDVAAAEGFFYWQGRSEDLFLEVREENVPNLDGVYDYLKDLRGTKYGVPTDGSLEGIIYRNDVGWEPSNWMDLLSDKEGTDRIGFEGSWYIYPFEVAAVTLDTAPGMQELYNEDQHQAVFDRMREFGQNVELWTGSFAEIESSLKQGIIDMSMWYSGMGNAAASGSDSLSWVTPSKTAGYLDHYCPVRGTDERAMAEDFLNHMLDPEVQSEWASEGYVYTSNEDVSYPDRVADQYPTSASEWENIKIADFTKLSEHSSALSSAFQDIKGN